MRVGCIIEARMNATRLPGKIMLDIMGRPSILRQVERIKRSRYIDQIIVATTTNQADDVLVETLNQNDILCFRGSEDDVLGRVAKCALEFQLDAVVEITGDCPLTDMQECDKVIERFLEGGYDLVSSNLLCTYPLGMAAIVFSNKVLQESALNAADPIHREHVCLYLYEHPYDYIFSNIEAPPFLRGPSLRMTLDDEADYKFICQVYEMLYPQNPAFTLYDIMKLLHQKPELCLYSNTGQIKKVR